MTIYPERIVCLTEETTETLYLLGEDRRIVGISGFTVRPPEARREKPKVSAFTSAKIEKILELKPDLVLGFSDLQADIAAELVRHGIEVHVFNHRHVADILRMILMLGGMIGCEANARALTAKLQSGLDEIRAEAVKLPRHPRVYFEEWDEPTNFRHRLGVGTRRHRRRRGYFSGVGAAILGKEPHHSGFAGSGAPSA